LEGKKRSLSEWNLMTDCVSPLVKPSGCHNQNRFFAGLRRVIHLPPPLSQQCGDSKGDRGKNVAIEKKATQQPG
jgi:hypothetical protein